MHAGPTTLPPTDPRGPIKQTRATGQAATERPGRNKHGRSTREIHDAEDPSASSVLLSLPRSRSRCNRATRRRPRWRNGLGRGTASWAAPDQPLSAAYSAAPPRPARLGRTGACMAGLVQNKPSKTCRAMSPTPRRRLATNGQCQAKSNAGRPANRTIIHVYLKPRTPCRQRTKFYDS
jgi:hypothetical protein